MYTHGHHETVLRSHRWRTAENSAGYLLPHLKPGMSLLDVGCGPGTITNDFAALVTPGEVTALEVSEDVLAVARSGIREPNVRLVVGDVYALDFPDDTFDVVHAHQVLQHLSDPAAALREMHRICRPGGLVAARDGDYAAFTWYPPSAALDEWLSIYRRVARHNGGEPDAGRRLLAWAHQAGLTDVTVSSSTWCFATPADRAYWGTTWADRIRQSAIATRALETAMATDDDLARISKGWLDWADDRDGWFSVLHGEILCRKAAVPGP
jgi:SAM-dependent methyltransferase